MSTVVKIRIYRVFIYCLFFFFNTSISFAANEFIISANTADGNSETRSTHIGNKFFKKIHSYELSNSLSYDYARVDKREVIRKGSFYLGLDKDLSPKYAWFIFSNTFYDKFKFIDVRESVGTGLKYTFLPLSLYSLLH